MSDRKYLATLLVVILSAALLTSVVRPQADARARIVHIASDMPAFDVYLNGELAAADLSFGGVSTYFSLPAGPAELSANIKGTTSQLTRGAITLDNDASVIVFTSSDSKPVNVIADDLSPLEFGMSRLLIVNALDDGSAIDIASTEDEWLTGEDIANGASMGSFEFSSDTIEFSLLKLSRGGQAVHHNFSAALAAGTSNVLLLFGDSNDPQLLRATAAVDADGQSGRVRFVHAVQGAAPIDLKADDHMIVPSLAFASPSEHIALPSGSHQLTLSLGGVDISSMSLNVSAGQMQTVAVMGSPAALRTYSFRDSLRDLDATSTVVNLVNAVPNGTVRRLRLESGAIVAADVSFGADGGAAQIVPGLQSMSMALEIGDDRGTVHVPPSHYNPGSYYSLIALPGSAFAAPRLLIAETSVARRLTIPSPSRVVASEDAPDSTTTESEPAKAMAQSDETPESDAPQVSESVAEVESSAEAEPATDADSAAVSATPDDTGPTLVSGPYAFVDLDPSARLQLRQFPSSDALSLGLLPGQMELTVLGRRGPTALHAGDAPELPVDLSDYDSDPAAALYPVQDLRPADTWLFVMYRTGDGGSLVGWVNAFYLQVFDATGDPQRLASLPMVRQNRAGSSVNTQVRPPDLSDRVTIRVDRLNPDALLNLRMANSTESEVLAQLPQDTELRLIGLDASEAWAFVDYESETQKIYRGWVSIAYLQLLLNGEPVLVTTLRALDESVAPTISDQARGSIRSSEASGPTPIPPTADMMKGIVGEIALDPGAMLHLRRHPNVDAESLAMIPAETKVAISGITQNAEWLKTSYNEADGWIAARYAALLLRGRLYNRSYIESLLPLHDNSGNPTG